MLDGPLAWAYAQRALARGEELAPITPDYAQDFPLPLERVDVADTWVWATSRATLDVQLRTAVEIRRRPAVAAMAKYATDRAYHAGLGPYKARDVTLPAELISTAVWHVLATDRQDLESLLKLTTHLGARHRNGLGRVRKWVIREDPDREAWRDRPMPSDDGQRVAIRAPYWHETRRYPRAESAC